MVGPLVQYAPGFGAELERLGYTPLSAVNQLRVMAHLSRWLWAEELDAGALTPECVDAFLAARRRQGYTCWLSLQGLRPLLGYLRGVGVVPRVVDEVGCGPVEEILASYRAYLLGERGLVAKTVRYYEADARLFLAQRADGDATGMSAMTAGEVTRFVMRECAVRGTGSAKILVTVLRSLLRFLLITGRIESDLVPAVPSVAGWRDAGLPQALEPGAAQALLASCDRRRAVGRRDYAILTVLVRLGLRAGEAAAMELGDIDWRAGEILIRGKGNLEDRLPLPVDVGQSLVAYLRRGRPDVHCTKVFLRARAPHGPLTSEAVKAVVRNACDRAGISGVGAHRLRHTAATTVLRAGASMPEVAQLLRHRHLASTAIYAKVDRAALRQVARPWPAAEPGGVS
ncbi:site-specific recombinase XerD [Kibdelosporangium banguiense]|uniref:Site-specific recombinase XerD n=1 Tax=Kibdelosporangium banguiense TaxID=1365924 RepID=A0ABS4TPK2_9PSEU|nr:site-specific recombinase XerD [Kibdelosporangium banguiense]